MSVFFSYFPKIEYSGHTATNIMVRARVRDIIRTNTVAFHPYTIKNGQRPDTIAHRYYGSSKHTWIVLYANDIRDPFFDWPMTYKDFKSFIIGKYGSVETAMTTVHEYKNENGFVIDETTYLATPENERSVVYKYEYEEEKNENKRNIKLIDNSYYSQLVSELRQIFQ